MVLVDIVDNVARRFIPFLPFLLSKNSLMLAQHIIAIACFLRVSELYTVLNTCIVRLYAFFLCVRRACTNYAGPNRAMFGIRPIDEFLAELHAHTSAGVPVNRIYVCNTD